MLGFGSQSLHKGVSWEQRLGLLLSFGEKYKRFKKIKQKHPNDTDYAQVIRKLGAHAFIPPTEVGKYFEDLLDTGFFNWKLISILLFYVLFLTLLAQNILSIITYSREKLLDIRATSTYQHYKQEYVVVEADPLF